MSLNSLRSLTRKLAAVCGGAALVALAIITAPWASLHADEPAAPPANKTAAAETSEKGKVADDPWIGLGCEQMAPQVPELVDDQQTILVITTVAVDGPAFRAGVRPLDVLISADGNPLETVEDLRAAVKAAAGRELKLLYTHDGGQREVSVRPERRPEQFESAPLPNADVERFIARWLTPPILPEAHPGFTFRHVHPGMIMPGRPGALEKLPEGMSISVTRSADQPAKITVRQGEQTFETTADKLDALPRDVRQRVVQFLSWELPSAAWALNSPNGALQLRPNMPGDEAGLGELRDKVERAARETKAAADAAAARARRAADQVQREEGDRHLDEALQGTERRLRVSQERLEQQLRSMQKQLDQVQDSLRRLQPPAKASGLQ
ncbi:MAG: PDZ domain-containing protein [Planctomycetes bacterium]|nr:PDZ domain-containing protein [Planctomycetota bacterium]